MRKSLNLKRLRVEIASTRMRGLMCRDASVVLDLPWQRRLVVYAHVHIGGSLRPWIRLRCLEARIDRTADGTYDLLDPTPRVRGITIDSRTLCSWTPFSD